MFSKYCRILLILLLVMSGCSKADNQDPEDDPIET